MKSAFRLALAGLAFSACAVAAENTVVLDTTGYWRIYQTQKPPVCLEGKDLKPVVSTGSASKKSIGGWVDRLSKESPPAPAGWEQPDFDDSAWLRSPAAAHSRTPYLARLCLRGKFQVTDPGKAGTLALSLGFHGGAIVYLNGKEVARKFVASGAEMADPYPADAFVDAQGKLIMLRGIEHLVSKDPVPPDTLKRIESRERMLEVNLPAAGLRSGVNVLAIDLVRAPYDKAVEEQKTLLKSHGENMVFELAWHTCQLRSVQLTSPGPAGLQTAAVRPAGLQVWNSDLLNADYDLDFGDPSEPLRPVHLVGVRNGVYSGKVVVGSEQPIQGLRAVAGDLSGPGGGIPAAQVQVRFALPWGGANLDIKGNNELTPYPADMVPLQALAPSAPAVIPVAEKKTEDDKVAIGRYGLNGRFLLKTPHQPAPVLGAVAGVWVSVRIPKDAKPGLYQGSVALEAGGKKFAAVPVEVKVLDWSIPDPYQWRTWVEMFEAPDTTSLEYNVPLWSEKHWALMEQSMKYLAEVGNKVLYIPLIAKTNIGHAETMVRWIKKGENKFEYDFELMEKYLDLAERVMGKPRFVVLIAWDRILMREGAARRAQDKWKFADSGPTVTTLSPDGKTAPLLLADYSDPVSKELWKPLYAQLRQRLAKHGLEKNLLLGTVSDFWATKDQAAFLKEMSGGLPWLMAGHYFQETFHNGLADFDYQSSYFGFAMGRHWQPEAKPHGLFERVPMDGYPIAKWRLLAEEAVSANRCGIGRIGGDTWYAVKDKNGKRICRPWGRWPAADWGYLSANSSTLAPGSEGPVATARFEAIREGAQECEAIIFLKEATAEAKRAALGEDLAKRCDALLNERNQSLFRTFISWQSGTRDGDDTDSWRETPSPIGHLWYQTNGWQARSEELYALAGEVAKKLGGK